MGELSIAHWLVILLIILITVLVIRGNRVRSWLARKVERSAFRELTPRRDGEKSTALRWFPFPKALAIVGTLTAVQLGIFIWLISFHDPLLGGPSETLWDIFIENARGPVVGFAVLVFVVQWFALVRAVILHFSPGHNRQQKYEWLLVVLSCVGLEQLPLYMELGVVRQYRDTMYRDIMFGPVPLELNPTALYLVFGLLNPVFLMIVLAGLQRFRARSPVGPQRRRAFVYRIVRRSTIPFIVLAVVHPISLICLWFRYFVIQEALEHPILYLRSFRYSDVPTAFGRIVNKATRPFGVVVAIVHQTQPESALTRYTNIADQPRVAVVPDLEWQQWVVDQLRNATAVIIDLTVETEGVAWELEVARSTGDAHVLVLLREGTNSPVPREFATLRYGLDWKSARAARTQLRSWLKTVLVQPAGGD